MYRLQSNQHVIYTGEAGMKAIRKAMEGHGKKKDKPQDEGLLKFAIQAGLAEGLVIKIISDTIQGGSDIEIQVNEIPLEYPTYLEENLLEKISTRITQEAYIRFKSQYASSPKVKRAHKSIVTLTNHKTYHEPHVYTDISVELFQISMENEKEKSIYKYSLTTSKLFDYGEREDNTKSRKL